MVTLEQVTKAYVRDAQQVLALDRVGLSVAAGEFLAVRGPSGSGKSTLLLTIGGMVRPSAGRVLLGGQDLYALSASRRAAVRADKIGFVFQMFHLVPYLSVLENVLSPALAGARTPRDDAIQLLERLGLADRLSHRPSELSAGERQRVAIARALVKRPTLILADEPTGNLDPDNAAQVMSDLAAFHRGGGTVVLVTHDPLADQYAGRALRLDGGRLEGPAGLGAR